MSGGRTKRLILQYAPIAVLVAIGVVVAFLGYTARTTREATIRGSQIFLANTVRTTSSLLRSIEISVGAAFERNRDLIEYTERRSQNEFFDVTAVSDFLARLVIEHEPVRAAYYYRPGDRIVYRHDTYVPLPMFAHLDALYEADAPSLNRDQTSWFYADYVAEYDLGASGEPSIVMMMGHPINQREKTAFVLVTISASSLREWFAPGNIREPGTLEITSGAGGDLLLTVNATARPEWLNEYTDRVRNLRYRTGVPAGSGYVLLVLLARVGWFVAGAFLVIAAVWLYAMVSRRNRIIARIIDVVSASSVVRSLDGSGTEYQFLETAVQDLVEHATAVGDATARSREYHVGYYFQSLIDRAEPDGELEAKLQSLFPASSDSRITLLLVEIDQFYRMDDEYRADDVGLLKLALRNAADTMAQDSFDTIWSQWVSKDRLVVLGTLLRTVHGSDPSVAHSCAESIRRWSEESLPMTVTVAVPDSVDRWIDAARAFELATRALGLKPLIGLNRVILEADLEGRESDVVFGLYAMVDRVCVGIRTAAKGWHEGLTGIFDGVRDSNLSKRDISGLVKYMTYELSRELDLASPTVRVRWREQWLPQLRRLENGFDLVQSLQAHISAIFSEIAAAVSQSLQDDTTGAVIAEMRAHIMDNLHDPSLSLDFYCSRYKMSLSQLSRAFKDRSGAKFVDFLSEARMQRAKDLLTSTNESIEWVAKKVGYLHPFSFSRAFRHHNDVSPSQFRRATPGDSLSTEGG